MPTVGGKRFPYTREGMARARRARKSQTRKLGGRSKRNLRKKIKSKMFGKSISNSPRQDY